jgi:hypothetical protein
LDALDQLLSLLFAVSLAVGRLSICSFLFGFSKIVSLVLDVVPVVSPAAEVFEAFRVTMLLTVVIKKAELLKCFKITIKLTEKLVLVLWKKHMKNHDICQGCDFSKNLYVST